VTADGTAPASAVASAGAQAAAGSASMQALQQNALGMLDAIQPMLSNPAMTARMNAQQKAQFKEITGLIDNMRAQLKSGRPMSPAEQSAQMMRIQQLTMSLMASGVQLPPLAAAPSGAAAPAPAPSAAAPRTAGGGAQ
jgi:hypothetical protein